MDGKYAPELLTWSLKDACSSLGSLQTGWMQYPCWVWMHCGDRILKASLQQWSMHPALMWAEAGEGQGLRVALLWLAPRDQALIASDSVSLLHLSEMKGRLFKATKGTPSVGKARKKWDVWLSAENWPAKHKILKEMEAGVNKKLVPNLWLKDLCRVWEHDSLNQSRGQSHSR